MGAVTIKNGYLKAPCKYILLKKIALLKATRRSGDEGFTQEITELNEELDRFSSMGIIGEADYDPETTSPFSKNTPFL